MEFISDRYEILDYYNEEIKFGKIYKGRDLKEGMLVFIQLIRDNNHVDKHFLPNLIDESTVLTHISSSNIAKILDVGVYFINDERCYYIISEFFSGIELGKVIKGNYMDLNSIVKIMKKILKTLDRAYNNKLYHGSLNEDNIFVDENYNIKIYDYCITKANKGVNIRKNNNSIYFLSPSQININYTEMESDFFTLGVILFDCIFKKMPFGIGKNEEDMLKLIDKGIDWSTVAINEENIALVNIVKKLINRTDKYKSVNEILIDLSKFMYIKAEIKNTKATFISEVDEKGTNKLKNSFLQKLILFVLTITILITLIYQFQ